MDGAIAQAVRDLCHIASPLPDHALCLFDLHAGEKLYRPDPRILPEDLLKLRASDQIVPADPGNRQLLPDMALHIANDPPIAFASLPSLSPPPFCGDAGKAPPIERDEKLREILADQLCPAKGGPPGKTQFFLIGIVHPPGKNGGSLPHDPSKKLLLPLIYGEKLPGKALHRGRAAEKADHHKTRRDPSIGEDIVKLTRSVKIHLSLPKRDLPLPGHDADLPVIHTDQLPKVMGLPREGEITLILKIMYGHNLFD